MVVTLSHTGYIKSQPLAEYRAQRRGGRGKQATQTKEDDWIDQLFIANTHDWILCFSNRGRVYWLKVWEVPQGGATRAASRSSTCSRCSRRREDHRGAAADRRVPQLPGRPLHLHGDGLGTVKKTALSSFSNPRKAGIIAVDLDEGDHLIGAALTDGKHDVMLFSDGGKAVRFDEDDVRPMGRNGARRARHGAGRRPDRHRDAGGRGRDQSVLTATENGYGKRTRSSSTRATAAAPRA
jgi:DNA gyrase subunit A